MQFLNPNSRLNTTSSSVSCFCHTVFNYNTFVLTFISKRRSGQKGERIREDWNKPLGLFIWQRMIKTNRRKNHPDFLAVLGKQLPPNQSANASVASGVVVVFCQLALKRDN